jgi:NAD(P)-dependent dehydrogenase (short-subunit alcohol dehydrogenase family)
MTISLPDTVTVVTGAAGGIGREVCKALRAAGAWVLATDMAADAPGIDADLYMQHDVTSEGDWRRIEAVVREQQGRLDALVNTAAISIVTRIEDTPLSEWHRVNSVNVDSIIIGTQVMLPLQRRRVDRQFLKRRRPARRGLQRCLLHEQRRGEAAQQVHGGRICDAWL